jgi:glycosyltransferase involved in cell wall biosynthesis
MHDFGIIMPNWNKSAYIGDAIASVLAQTDESWQLVIVDDASTDGSLEAIRPFLADSRVSVSSQPVQRGPGAACRIAMSLVDAPFLAVLDSDDALVPHALERMRLAYRYHSDCGLIYSQNIRCDEHLNPNGEAGRGRPIPPGMTALDIQEQRGFLRITHFRTFTREAYDRTDGYAPLARHQDMDLVFKLEEVTKTFFLDEPLYLYRVLEDGLHTGARVPGFAAQVTATARERRKAALVRPTSSI